MATRRDVYDHAIQAQTHHKIEAVQLDRIEKLASTLPPSEKNLEYLWTLFVAVQKEGRVEIFTYDRREPPAVVRRIFDLAGAYLPEGDIFKITKIKHTPWEPTTIPICDINMLSSHQVPTLVSNCEIVTIGSGNRSVSLIAMNDKSTPFIGPKLDMYLHGFDRKGSDIILGFLLVDSHTLKWGENVLVDYPTNLTTVADFIKSPGVSIDMAKLADFYDNSTPRTSLGSGLFSRWAFTEIFGEKVKIANASVETNLLKIKIENPGCNFHGEAWIDLKTKEVVRAIEAGKVVFPK